MAVAIIGLSPTTHNQAPFGDEEWELWGLPWDEGYWVHYDRLFEMHDMRLLEKENSRRPSGYLDRLREVDVPLYMQEEYFPSAIKYPFEMTAQYINSSIAYMLALAIYEGHEKIGIYGVDMKAEDEYGYQKPNIEYLIGLAEGQGIEVIIPKESPLLKFNGEGIMFANTYPKYVGRYGWLGDVN
jgi:hypothetical protein